jgi:hypothetical protein
MPIPRLPGRIAIGAFRRLLRLARRLLRLGVAVVVVGAVLFVLDALLLKDGERPNAH